MAIVKVEDTILTDIGNSIRNKLGASTLYLPNEMAPAILTIPDAPAWEWGSETEPGAGDATWFRGLKEWMQTATDEEMQACVGKTKSVTLTTAVAAVTTHLVRCIGANQDGPKTMTFQTVNNLKKQSAFLSSSTSLVKWGTCQLRSTYIAEYYEAFPAKDCIKLLAKQYTYGNVFTTVDDYVWIISLAELGQTIAAGGFIPYSDEYTAGGSMTPYSYYADLDATKRIKDFGDDLPGRYNYCWTRSRAKNTSTNIIMVNGRDGAMYRSSATSSTYQFAPCFTIG